VRQVLWCPPESCLNHPGHGEMLERVRPGAIPAFCISDRPLLLLDPVQRTSFDGRMRPSRALPFWVLTWPPCAHRRAHQPETL
jgi:hypothetical protein